MNATQTNDLMRCLCQMCSKEIEFDPAHINQNVVCPHCGIETLAYTIKATPPPVTLDVMPETAKGGFLKASSACQICGTRLYHPRKAKGVRAQCHSCNGRAALGSHSICDRCGSLHAKRIGNGGSTFLEFVFYLIVFFGFPHSLIFGFIVLSAALYYSFWRRTHGIFECGDCGNSLLPWHTPKARELFIQYHCKP